VARIVGGADDRMCTCAGIVSTGCAWTLPNKPLQLTIPPQGLRVESNTDSAAGLQLNGKAFGRPGSDDRQ
jgi:hypothetical protein